MTVALTDLTISTIETAYKDFKNQSNDHVQQKSMPPLGKIQSSSQLTASTVALDWIRQLVAAYNPAVDEANREIAAKKAATAAGNVTTEETKLALLKNTQARYRPKVEALCLAYETRRKEKKTLEEDKEKAKDALDLYVNSIFTTYQDQVNKLLLAFGADFQIANTTRSYVGGKASSSYEITINSQSVQLGDNRTAPGEACFRNTLSMGDRSALAMAFFLVKLAHDPEIGSKCVIFDDLVSSLDRFRMGCTVQQILNVMSKANRSASWKCCPCIPAVTNPASANAVQKNTT